MHGYVEMIQNVIDNYMQGLEYMPITQLQVLIVLVIVMYVKFSKFNWSPCIRI
jgi:hypothetical protein